MFFDSEFAEDDIVRSFGTVKVVVDPESAELIKGGALDYQGRSPGRRLPHHQPERYADLRLRLVFQLS